MKVKLIFTIVIANLMLLSCNVYAEEARISEAEIEASQELIAEEITRENAVMLLSEIKEPTIVETWDISATEEDDVTATLYSNGLLKITGTGAMENWVTSSYVPWDSNRKEIQAVTIHKGVTNIGSCAFAECRSLTSIDIPESITSIGNYVFAICRSLTSINIPESVTSIGGSAFYYCSNLTSINIPESVTSIGISAFYGCSSLTSINIPESLTSIGNSAFISCSSLTSINIPESITSIGSYAFDDCSSLISINIPESVTSIGGGAFRGCSSLTSINIPEGVTNVESLVFNGCSSLTSINIPESVTSIGNYAFKDCSGLISINIPESVKSIGNYAFNGCSSLTSINIPESITSIGSNAFYGCKTVVAVQTGTNNGQKITTSLPQLLQRTLDEEDIMYANGTAPTLKNCTISTSTDNQTITFNTDDVANKNVTVTIKDGPLNRSSDNSSSTIWYNFLQHNKLDKSSCNSKNLYRRWRNNYK